jgi:hypothetical protein
MVYWTVAGVVLALVLLAAWWFARRHGFETSAVPGGAALGQAQADQALTHFVANQGHVGPG